jgi:hypothetical protein
MNNEDIESGASGVVADVHPPIESLPILVSPSTAGKGRNTIRMEVIPIACCKVSDAKFEFESSFVLPKSAEEFREVSRLRKANAGAPLSVFGHADPTGDDAFNKGLSGRRAEAVYAVFVRDVNAWEGLYNEEGKRGGWGTRSIQIMLNSLGYNAGPEDGVQGNKTTEAIQSFQTRNRLRDDGIAGPVTRATLFKAYMDFLSPDTLTKADFLAKGTGSGLKGDVQGCGEFNPFRVFSKQKQQELSNPSKKPERDAKNAVNRRVMVLLFRPGTVVSPGSWPCPTTREGTEACRLRFWSDGDQRRTPQAQQREFPQTRDTFACRFYQRLVTSSPCEGILPTILTHWIEIELVDDAGHPMADVRYLVKPPAGAPVEGKLDKNGRARIERIAAGTCKVTFPDLNGDAWREIKE